MNGAELKETLKGGGRVYGTMISVSRNPRWIPVLDGVGLDYVIIDTEHNPRSRGELGDFLVMFNTIGVVPIVRIPIPDSHYVTMAVDAGAQGVLAPYCETVEQVREVVAAAKWRPLKGESVDRLVATGEHVSDATKAYLEARGQRQHHHQDISEPVILHPGVEQAADLSSGRGEHAEDHEERLQQADRNGGQPGVLVDLSLT